MNILETKNAKISQFGSYMNAVNNTSLKHFRGYLVRCLPDEFAIRILFFLLFIFPHVYSKV